MEAKASAEPWPERGPAPSCHEQGPQPAARAPARGPRAPRRVGTESAARQRPASPDLSKLNLQNCQESRLGTENREPSETLGRILDSWGLSKTVVCAGPLAGHHVDITADQSLVSRIKIT